MRRRTRRRSVVRVASLLSVRGTPTTRSAAGARRHLLPAAIAAAPQSKARAIARSTAAARRREAEVERVIIPAVDGGLAAMAAMVGRLRATALPLARVAALL